MTEKDLVSVIMPTYNSARFVAESIESIMHQTYQNWELLITDDCSQDGTVAIVEQYAKSDSRVKLFHLPTNGGAGAARNNSIKEAHGRYIAFCDSDDRWASTKLEKQITFMRERNLALSYSSYYVCNEASQCTGLVMAQKKLTLTQMKRDNKIGFLTAIYDTMPYGKHFMPTLRKRQDWALLLHILKHCGKAEALTEPLAYYRLSSNSISHDKMSLVKYNVEVYKSVFNYSPAKAYSYFFLFFLPAYAMKVVDKRLTTLRHKQEIEAAPIIK